MRQRALNTFIIGFVSLLCLGIHTPENNPDRCAPFAPVSVSKADSLLGSLSLDEKLGMLIISTDTNPAQVPVSGVLVTDPRVASRLNVKAAGLTPFVVIDIQPLVASQVLFGEDDAGRIANPETYRYYTKSWAEYFCSSGINAVLGPQLAVFRESYQGRSFSDDPEEVAAFGEAWFSGIRESGLHMILGNFPGEGSLLDSKDKGQITASPGELNRVDMVPFKRLINLGLQGVSVSNHPYAGGADSTNGMQDQSDYFRILRQQLGFNGLIWYDARNLPRRQVAEALADAVAKGTNQLVVSVEPETAIAALRDAVNSGQLTVEQIDDLCRAVVQAKLWVNKCPLKKAHLFRSKRERLLNERKLITESITLLRNKNQLIPLKNLDTLNPVIVVTEELNAQKVDSLARRYGNCKVKTFRHETLERDFTAFLESRNDVNLVLFMAAESQNNKERKHGLSAHLQSVIERMTYEVPTALVWFGNERALRYIDPTLPLHAVLVAPIHEHSADLVIQCIYGGRPLTGKLRKNIADGWKRGSGTETEKTRLAHGMPEELGIDPDDLTEIDRIMEQAISEKACPGAQIWFSKDGIVIYNKTFGCHTYQCEQKVRHNDLYDLASITKIAATGVALMKLTDQGKFNLDRNLCDYLSPEVDTTPYMNMNLREIFAHQAGLPPFIPFYQNTLVKGVPRYDVYSLAQSDIYPHRVARNLYIHRDQPERMFRQILSHPISNEKKYKYSDVGYYFAVRIIERLTRTTLDHFVDTAFYKPLGLTTMTFKPLEKFDKMQITPTEYDRTFRNQLIHGDVHDPGAAMMGGVAGHAGLFSNANDLGILMQMLLNGGQYGGRRYLSQATIKDFTRCQFCENDNRRGATFDKPLRNGQEGPSCGCTDIEAFGHQGFTGTVTWADPREHAVYVFLSNRVYPNADNRKLAEMNVRTEVQKVFYRAIEKANSIAGKKAEG
ncbi:MAG: glycoside hydrolase family 3 N-terminal domain-containing protein [Salibacteraceae bacterium]